MLVYAQIICAKDGGDFGRRLVGCVHKTWSLLDECWDDMKVVCSGKSESRKGFKKQGPSNINIFNIFI